MDLVFTNSETLVSQVEMGDRFDESDHNEIRFKINAKRKEEQNMALMPDFRKANYQGLRTHLQSVKLKWLGMPRRIQRVFTSYMYRAKAKEGIGPLKGLDGILKKKKGEEISKELNNYFLSVLTQEEPDGELELEQIK